MQLTNLFILHLIIRNNVMGAFDFKSATLRGILNKQRIKCVFVCFCDT